MVASEISCRKRGPFTGSVSRYAFMFGLLLVLNSCEAAIFCPWPIGPFIIPTQGPFGGGYDPSCNPAVPQGQPGLPPAPAVQSNGYPGQAGQLSGGVSVASQVPQQNVPITMVSPVPQQMMSAVPPQQQNIPLNLLMFPNGQIMMQVVQDPQQNTMASPQTPQQNVQTQYPQMMQYSPNVNPIMSQNTPYRNSIQSAQSNNPQSLTSATPQTSSLSNYPVYYEYEDPPKSNSNNQNYKYHGNQHTTKPPKNYGYYDEADPNVGYYQHLPIPKDLPRGIIIYDDGTTDPHTNMIFKNCPFSSGSSEPSDTPPSSSEDTSATARSSTSSSSPTPTSANSRSSKRGKIEKK